MGMERPRKGRKRGEVGLRRWRVDLRLSPGKCVGYSKHNHIPSFIRFDNSLHKSYTISFVFL